MRCKKVIRQLSAYLDGQLTAAEREAARSHIAGCARCRGEMEALERTAYAVADLPRLRAPSDLRDQVMAKLDGVAPAEARPPQWRMYWGAAAAVVFAVVIMLLITPRRTEPGAVAPAAKNVPVGAVALADRGGSAAPKSADEKSLREATELKPPGGPAYSFGGRALQTAGITPASSEQIVLPSANPRAAYFNAVAVAAKGGWLPAELQKDGAAVELLKAGKAEQGGLQVLQLTLCMKRSQVPLLKNALATAGLLQAAEKKGDRDEEARPTYVNALRLEPARADLDETHKSRIVAGAPTAAPAEALTVLEDRITTAKPATAAATPLAPAAMKAPVGGGAAAAGPQQPIMAEQAGQPTEATTLGPMRKAEAAEAPLVQVTLLFPLAESPVPAAPPAAGAANSVTPE